MHRTWAPVGFADPRSELDWNFQHLKWHDSGNGQASRRVSGLGIYGLGVCCSRLLFLGPVYVSACQLPHFFLGIKNDAPIRLPSALRISAMWICGSRVHFLGNHCSCNVELHLCRCRLHSYRPLAFTCGSACVGASLIRGLF